MNLGAFEIVCPHCRGELGRPAENELVCRNCGRRFPVLLGIPDLRVFPDPYIGIEEERAKVEKLAARFGGFDFESFIDFYYSITSVVPPQHAQMYKRGLLAGVSRARASLAQWERRVPADEGLDSLEIVGQVMELEEKHGVPAMEAVEQVAARREPLRLLDLGCGTAPLLVAAGQFPERIGVDIALRWLVVAKKRLEQAGLDAPLVAACAEALPFADRSFDRVAGESVLEHVTDQPKALTESHRVLRSGGAIFLSAPNRRSIGPDPQTGIWCGSFLPESWTAARVIKQGGIPPIRRLLTSGELLRLLRQAGFEAAQTWLPEIPAEQRAQFSSAMRAAIAAYSAASATPVLKLILKWIGPIFLAAARKPPG